MKLLEKILLPVDFLHDNNESLINTAVYLAEVFNSEITVINVIPQKSDDEQVKKYFKKYAEDNISSLERELKSRGVHRLKSLLEYGSPFERILGVSEKEDFNVILAGPGNNTSASHNLGVTVRKLIRKTSIPVWVVRPDAPGTIKRIFCPVDFSDASKRALSNAILLASKTGAELKLISVYEPIDIISRRISADLDDYNQKSRASYEEQLERFLKDFNFDKIKFSSEVLMGKPEEVILDELNKKHYDLLLMGTTGRTALSRILVGSVTEKVIEECLVSFITTKNRNILNPEYELKIANLESLLNKARQSMDEGDYERATMLFEKAMAIDDLLVPAVMGASEAYEKLNNKKKANQHRQHAQEIVRRLFGEEGVRMLGNLEI